MLGEVDAEVRPRLAVVAALGSLIGASRSSRVDSRSILARLWHQARGSARSLRDLTLAAVIDCAAARRTPCLRAGASYLALDGVLAFPWTDSATVSEPFDRPVICLTRIRPCPSGPSRSSAPLSERGSRAGK